MTKYLIKLLLFIILGLLAVPFLGSCQVKPNEFIEETSPTNSNFEMYSQKNGINRRASLANLKKYFTPYIYGTIAYVPSASGNASNRMEFVVDPNGDSWYIDAGGVGTKLGKSYTAGTGISITGSTITNSGLLPSTTFGGDVTGTYDNLQIGAGKVGTLELTTTGTSSGSFTLPTLTTGPDGRVYSISSNTIGGDVSGTVGNIQIMPGVVGTTELADNSVTTAKIGAAQVTLDKIAQAGATSGQAIVWNGTGWAPGADTGTTYTGGTGISVVGTTITNTAPDQVVTIAGATGTYPNFTVTPGITGSGIANRMAYWNGTSSLTSSANITTDGTEIRTSKFAIGAPNSVSRKFTTQSNASAGAGALRINTNVVWNASTGAIGTLYIKLHYHRVGGNYYNTECGLINLSLLTYSGTGAYFQCNVIGGWTRGTYAYVYKDVNDKIVFVLGATTDDASYIFFVDEVQYDKSSFNGDVITNMQGVTDVSSLTLVASCANIVQTKSIPFYLNSGINGGGTNTLIRLGNNTAASDAEVAIGFYPNGVTGSEIGSPTGETGYHWTIAAKKQGHSQPDLIFRNQQVQKARLTSTGCLIIGDGTTTAKLEVIGNGATSGTNSAIFKNSNGNELWKIRNDGQLSASAYPNTRNDAGLPVNVFSSTITGGIESHTAAELVAAGGGVTANIATASLTSTGSHTLTLANNTLTFDASTSTNTISQPIIIKTKADGVNSGQPLTFQDAANSTVGYIYQNNQGITLAGTTGKSIVVGSGTFGWVFHPNGVFVNPTHTSDPTTTGLSGSQWLNITTNRFKFRTSSGVKTVATLEDDMTGTLTTYAADATPIGASYGNIVDAFTAARTVTLGADMTEGRFYTVKARRNTTNTITVNAASGYTLEIDADASIGPTTFNMAVGETILAQRFGTVILIKR